MKPRSKNKLIDVRNSNLDSPEKVKLKNSISHKRNQGSKRLMKYMRDHHKATGYQIKAEFRHTWQRGKSYSYQSDNWGDPRPLAASDVAEKADDNMESLSDSGEPDNLPSSQTWGLREPAKLDGGTQKKDMKSTCDRCFKGKKKNEVWLKCGVRGCSSLNVHARCINVQVPNKDTSGLAKFCINHIRCSKHMGKSHIPPVAGSLGDLADSDADIENPVHNKQVQKKMRKSDTILIGSDTEFNPSKSKPPKKKPRMPNSKKPFECSKRAFPVPVQSCSQSKHIDNSEDDFSDP